MSTQTFRGSIRPSFLHGAAAGRAWPVRRVVGAVLGLWVVTAALLGAIMIAIVWDLRR